MNPKYRQLTSEELQLLEKDFIDFLVVNGITADDWLQIKKEDGEKTRQFLTLFSDVVFEKMMRKTEYLLKRIGDLLMCFHYDENEAKLILVNNLESDKPISELTPKDILSGSTELSKQSKPYKNQRELEVFELIQGGAQISDGDLFKKLSEQL